MDAAKSRRMQTIDRLIAGYSSLSVSQLLEPLDPDFHHETLPESLGTPRRDRAAFALHASGIFEVFRSFRLIPNSIIDDADAGVVVISARMIGAPKWGQEPWTNECVMTVRLTDDGSRILSIREFVDSAKAMKMVRIFTPANFGPVLDSDGAVIVEEDDSSWGLFNSDIWIHIGAVALVMFGLQRLLR